MYVWMLAYVCMHARITVHMIVCVHVLICAPIYCLTSYIVHFDCGLGLHKGVLCSFLGAIELKCWPIPLFLTWSSVGSRIPCRDFSIGLHVHLWAHDRSIEAVTG